MLPKLYSLRSDGKIQEWSVEVKKDKYRFHSGIYRGEIVESKWTECIGKNIGKSNETTPEQQAELEARSHHQKKLDSGYKINIKDVRDVGFEPMLAKKYESVDFPVYTQPKLDGVRCIWNNGDLWSRNKKVLMIPHIKNILINLPKNIILDGELYTDKLSDDFNKIISLVRKTKPTPEDLKEAEKYIEYHVYDTPSNNDFRIRSGILKNIVFFIDNPKIKFVETIECKNEDELDQCYEKWLIDGYEGQMVRLDEPYENKRSSNLLKRKEFIDEEFILLDIKEGIGNRSGMAGYCVFKTAAGKEFKANIKGGFEFYKQLLKKKKEYIGKEATVKYHNLTPDGIPRFPVVIKFEKE